MTAVTIAIPRAAHTGRPIVGYGGRIYQQQPEWRARMAGNYLGNTFRDGLANIEKIMVQWQQ